MPGLRLPLSVEISAANRSRDQPELHPFVTTTRIRSKLAFVHCDVRTAAAVAAMRVVETGSSGGAAEPPPGSSSPRP